MKLETRIQMEQRIARKVVRGLLEAGYELNIDNGGDDWEIAWSRDFDTVVCAMFATDDEYLVCRKEDEQKGWVRFIYGNQGWEVINDYTVNLEPILEPINQYCDRLSELYA